MLIYDHIIKGEKLKIGGMLSRMVKDNREQLSKILEKVKEKNEDINASANKGLPKYGYLRLNKFK